MDSSDDDEFVNEWDQRRRFIAQLGFCLVCYYHISKNKSHLEHSISSGDDYQTNKRRHMELMDNPTTPYEATSKAHNTEAPPESATTSSKKRKATSGLDEEKLNVTLDRMTRVMEMGNKLLEASNEQKMMSDSQFAEVSQELMSLGLDDETYIKAYSFLGENPVKAKAFLNCLVDKRVQYLMFQLGLAGMV